MILGSLLGMMCCVAVGIGLSLDGVHSSWTPPTIAIAGAFLLIYAVFGSRIRKVRGEEVIMVLTAYLAQFHSDVTDAELPTQQN